MKVVQGIAKLDEPLVHTVVTIGNFDGVHLGHQAIISLALEKARGRGGVTVGYTFRPHPQIALRPESSNVRLLCTYDERAELLAQTGLDYLIEEPFSREFSTTSAEQFFKEILLRRLHVEAIVVGYDFKFGKEREGSLERLESLCRSAGVELTIVQPQRFDSEVVSSSRIRQHLLAGEVEKAQRLLGRPFFYRGVVLKGEGRGRKIGFPTANLALESKITLPYGVYATQVALKGEAGKKLPQDFPAVTNVGVRPTFDKDHLPALIETHLLDQDLDLYGSTLEVRFIQRIREERKFSGVEALKNQIQSDCALARTLLSAP
jgi:riboflavin kinase/FMN adenylyltransferase